MGGFRSTLQLFPYGVEAEDVSGITGLFPGGAGGTPGVSGDDSPSPVNR